MNINIVRELVKGLIPDITDRLIEMMQAGPIPFLTRAVVREVIFDPIGLDERDRELLKTVVKDGYSIDSIPRNSVIASRVRRTGESNLDHELFYPFFSSHLALPVKPGEQIFVLYEGAGEEEQGYWITRAHERRDVEDVNYTHADRKFIAPVQEQRLSERAGITEEESTNPFSFPNGLDSSKTSTLSGDPKRSYEDIVESSLSSLHHVIEPVPRYTARPGELVLQGSNNSLVALGKRREPTGATDLVTDAAGDRSGLATIDIVVGRGLAPDTAVREATNSRNQLETNKSIDGEEPRREGDPDAETDAARVFLASKIDPDAEFAISLPEGVGAVQLAQGTSLNEPAGGTAEGSAILLRCDRVRIDARQDIKITVGGGAGASLVLTAGGDVIVTPGSDGFIRLGGPDADKAILTTDLPASTEAGNITADPILTTMGGLVGTGRANQGTFSSKVLIK